MAWLDSSLGYGLRLPVLEFSLKRYRNNQHKATLGLEYALTHTLPLTLKERILQTKEQLAESAKTSSANIAQKAKKATELARTKAERANTKNPTTVKTTDYLN